MNQALIPYFFLDTDTFNVGVQAGPEIGLVQGRLSPSLDLNMTNSPYLDPRITFTRAGTATYFDATGVMQTASTNVARIDYGTNSTPSGVTNWIRNSSMAGAIVGTPGTLPTNWAFNTFSGLSQQVVGTGTESGIAYVDVRIFGTSSGTSLSLRSDTTTAIPAISGQAWTHSAYVKIVGGTTANVTSVNLSLSERLGAGTNIASVDQIFTPGASGANLALSRFTQVWTLPDATTVYLTPSITFIITTASAIDITLRVGAVQLEQASTVHDFVATSTIAANVGATAKGLLIEQARTNVLIQSAALATTTWNPFGAVVAAPTVTNAIVTAPDGTLTGASMVFPAVPSASNVAIQSQNLTATVSIHAFSVWLRGSVGGEQIYMQVFNAASTVYYRNRVTLTTSWQRFSVVTAALTAASWYVSIGNDFRDVSSAATLAQTIYAWGAQLEAGVGVTSLIPTTTASVTRAADSATMAIGSWFNPVASTVLVEGITTQATPAGANTYWASLDDSTANNRITIMQPTSSLDVDAFVVSGGVITANQINHFTTIPNTAFKYSIAVNNAVSYASCANGLVPDSGLSASYLMPVGVNRLTLGTGGSIPCNGYIRRIRYWPRALSNFELQQATL